MLCLSSFTEYKTHSNTSLLCVVCIMNGTFGEYVDCINNKREREEKKIRITEKYGL